jgi:hypothetical protein
MRDGANEQFRKSDSKGVEPEVLSRAEIINGEMIDFEEVGKEPNSPEKELQEYFKLRAEAVLLAQEKALSDYKATGEGLSPDQVGSIRDSLIVNKGMAKIRQRKNLFRGNNAA